MNKLDELIPINNGKGRIQLVFLLGYYFLKKSIAANSTFQIMKFTNPYIKKFIQAFVFDTYYNLDFFNISS